MYRLSEPARRRNARRSAARAAGMRDGDDRTMHPTESGRHAVTRPSPTKPPAPPTQAIPSRAVSAYGANAAQGVRTDEHAGDGSVHARRSERALAAERRIGRAAFLLDDLVRIPGTGMRLGI